MSKPEGNIVLTHTDLLFIVVYGPIIIRGLLLAKDSPIASFISKFFTKFFLPSITNEPLGRNCPVGAPFFTWEDNIQYASELDKPSFHDLLKDTVA